MNSFFVRLLLCTITTFSGLTLASAQLLPGSAEVNYNPGLTRVEGDEPLDTTVYVQVTSPSNTPFGIETIVTPVISVLSKPAGASDEEALSYISFNPVELVFTGPNQTISARIDLFFPEGVEAGVYQYKFITAGWLPGTQDLGGFLNATIYPAPTPNAPPSVTIATPEDNTTFTYFPAQGPLSIPVSFTSKAPASTPLTSIDADINGASLALTNVTNPDGSVTSTASYTINHPGVFTLRARATNAHSTATDTTDFTVEISAPPPTATISKPVLNSSYKLGYNGTVSVPYSFAGRSYHGGITELTATLNGDPVTFTPQNLYTLNATGSGNFVLNAPGTYTLVVTATDENGTATTSTSFSVTAATAPPPTVSICLPTPNAVYTRKQGSGPVLVPFTFSAQAGNGTKITSISATLNGKPISIFPFGVNSSHAYGLTSLCLSTPGTYTLVATAKSGSLVGSDTTTFVIKETVPPPPPCKISWLPPVSLGKVQKGGSVLPIKFTLSSGGCKNYRDTSVVIAISEIYANGSSSTPKLHTYDRRSPNAPTYTISSCDMYHLNFPTAKGCRRYRIEVYRTVSGSSKPQLIGTKEFTTK